LPLKVGVQVIMTHRVYAYQTMTACGEVYCTVLIYELGAYVTTFDLQELFVSFGSRKSV